MSSSLQNLFDLANIKKQEYIRYYLTAGHQYSF